MQSGFFKWLGGISELLFIANPADLLVFLQLGIGLTIFALSYFLSIRGDIDEFQTRFEGGGFYPTPPQQRMLQAKRRFFQLLQVITSTGSLNYLAAPLAFLLMTFERSNPIIQHGSTPISTPPPGPDTGFIIFSNLTFFLMVIPTFYISIYYIYYRMFLFRLHKSEEE